MGETRERAEDAPLAGPDPAITEAHICGLVVGEGCFYAESARDPGYRLGWRIRPAFCIEMRRDERPVLEAVRAYLDCGGIYVLDFGRYEGYRRKRWHPHTKFRVSSVRDLHAKVVPFFETHHLFGRKRVAFDIFKQLVVVVYERRHLEPGGLIEAKALAAELARHNERGISPADTGTGGG
ncbi:MAG TPA: LAGLIDADG family homing endonuclease [Actinomycetota bacterium]